MWTRFKTILGAKVGWGRAEVLSIVGCSERETVLAVHGGDGLMDW